MCVCVFKLSHIIMHLICFLLHCFLTFYFLFFLFFFSPDLNKDGRITLEEFVTIAKNAEKFPIVNFLL